MPITTFYNPARLLSHNATFNFVCGDRGFGKSFAFKKRAINNWIKRGEQFLYLRRYKNEISKSRDSFFRDIQARGLFQDYDFRINGYTAQATKVLVKLDSESEKVFASRSKNRKWETIGFFFALSQAASVKSTSFPEVTMIIFDEFIKDKTNIQYLPDEEKMLKDMYETIDRGEERTKVFCLANAVSMMNPYFIAYEIQPDNGDEFVLKYKIDGKYFVCCQFPNSEQFRTEKFQTAFGKFAQLTDPDYADYAMRSIFSDAHDRLVFEKPENSIYWITLETSKGTFSIWSEGREFYIQSRRPRGNEILYTMIAENMDTGRTLMHYNDKGMQLMRSAFNQARVTFDKPSTRNVFAQIFERRA